MNRKLNILFIGAAVLALAACSKDGPFPQEDRPTGMFYYEIPLENNEGIRPLGIYAKVGANTSVNQASGINNDASPRTVRATSTVAVTPGSTLYAYYPYHHRNDAAPYTAAILNIPTEQTQGEAGLDADAMPMMAVPYVATEALGTPGAAPLRMTPLGSLVCFKLYSGTGSSDRIARVDLIATSGIGGDFTYDLSSQTAANPTGMKEKSIHTLLASPLSLSGATSTGTAKEVYMIAAPGKFSGEIHVYLADASGVVKQVRKQTFSNQTFSRGQRNEMTVNVTSGTLLTNGIWNASDLIAAKNAVNSSGDYSKYAVDGKLKLMNDIDMAGSPWTPFTNLGVDFDGNGCSIKNWNATTPLINTLASGKTVSNLTIDGSCTYAISAGGAHAFVVKTNNGFLKNITVNGTMATTGVIGGYAEVGGVVASSYTTDAGCIDHCVNNADISIRTSTHIAVGGIMAASKKEPSGFVYQITHCQNNGSIMISCASTSEGSTIGGIAGYSNKKYGLQNCQNTGNIAVDDAGTNRVHVGGVRAYTQTADAGITNNCANNGPISVVAANESVYVGGISSGYSGWMQNCYNSADISVTASGNSSTSWIGGLSARNGSTLCYGGQQGDIRYTYSGSGTPTAYIGLVCGESTCAWQKDSAADCPHGTIGGSITTNAKKDVDKVYCGALIGKAGGYINSSNPASSSINYYWGHANAPLNIKKGTRIDGAAPPEKMYGVTDDSPAINQTAAKKFLIGLSVSNATYWYRNLQVID